MRPIVKRDVDTELRASVEQSGPVRVLANDAGRLVLRDTVCPVREQRPILSVVVGAVDVRRKVSEQVAVDCEIGSTGLVWAGLDILHPTARCEAFGCDVGPGFAVVARDIDQAVIGTGPDKTFGDGRFADRVGVL